MAHVQTALIILAMWMASASVTMAKCPTMVIAKNIHALIKIKYGILFWVIVSVKNHWYGCWANANIQKNAESMNIGLAPIVSVNGVTCVRMVSVRNVMKKSPLALRMLYSMVLIVCVSLATTPSILGDATHAQWGLIGMDISVGKVTMLVHRVTYGIN